MRFDREFTKEEAAAYVLSEIRAIASSLSELDPRQQTLLGERVQRERASELPASQDLARLEDLFERWAQLGFTMRLALILHTRNLAERPRQLGGAMNEHAIVNAIVHDKALAAFPASGSAPT